MSADGNTLARELEEMEDQRDALAGMLARVRSANQETLPWGLVKRLSVGEPPLRVWREHRGVELKTLASNTGIGILSLTAVDQGAAEFALGEAVAIARALDINAEDLLPWRQD